MTQSPWALEFASDELRADREVVLAAVSQHGFALQYASDALRDDAEVVLAAVKMDGVALKFASDELRGDREVVLGAVRCTHMHLCVGRGLCTIHKDSPLRFASQELQSARQNMLSRSLVPSQLCEALISQDAIHSVSVLVTICCPYIEYRKEIAVR